MLGQGVKVYRSVTVPSRSLGESIRLPQRRLNPWVLLHLLLGVIFLDGHVDEFLMMFDESTDIARDVKEEDREKNGSI